eukprot:jgi/Bigna1/78239/fgenesh1_pg.53_\
MEYDTVDTNDADLKVDNVDLSNESSGSHHRSELLIIGSSNDHPEEHPPPAALVEAAAAVAAGHDIEMERLVGDGRGVEDSKGGEAAEEEEREGKGLDDLAARQWILRQPIIYKFCAYGFLKNLQFFEAYLYVMLLAYGYDLSHIGLLQGIQACTTGGYFVVRKWFCAFSIELRINALRSADFIDHATLSNQMMTVMCEYPSGVIADRCGKKISLLSSFIMYMVSFLLYSFGSESFAVLAIAAMLYGMGEALRSGCHKAMILQWLERHGHLKQKTFLYSRTRSFSNLGSAINAVTAVCLVVFVPGSSVIFLGSIVPMMLDFILVATYPSYLNVWSETPATMWSLVKDEFSALVTLLSHPHNRRKVLSSSIFQASHKTLKDYIQPIMVILGGEMLKQWRVSGENRVRTLTKVVIGCTYALFYLVSCAGTRNSWRIAGLFSSEKTAMDRIFDAFLVLAIGIGVFVWTELPVLVIPAYLFLYFLTNTRRPLAMSQVSELMGKKRRATVLSVESLLNSIAFFILAPACGFIAHHFGISVLFLAFGVSGLLLNFLYLSGDPVPDELT